ncbi:MAG: type III PLP-dependent enzyme [Hyphomicrobiaceae bacterium]|nr:type III PLP-dependent enzyme [Hyphomicrobiaceae bacterium]
MDKHRSAAALIRSRKPNHPVIGLRPHAAYRAARWFLDNFPGEVAYAYKANDSSFLLGALYGAGIRHFDVASMAEVEAASHIKGAHLHFMNPVKPRHAIRRAYFEFGVRTFALDCEQELRKILEETDHAKDLALCVRIAPPAGNAVMPLSGKYGVSGAEAAELLRTTRQVADELGVTFHVGSQTTAPDAYVRALEMVHRLIVEAGVVVDIVDVGGGFPSRYLDSEPAPLKAFTDTIAQAVERMAIGEHCRIFCEPGRALAAEAESLIVKVDARRGNELFINDGAYGVLFDSAVFGVAPPARQVGTEQTGGGKLEAFSLWGPTCDSFDRMKGPFLLPASIAEGDYIEFGNVGAYGRVLASRFNGFGNYEEVVLLDEPMTSLYAETSNVTPFPGVVRNHG